jgi:putative selenate reductase
LYQKKGILVPKTYGVAEAARCLSCNTVCEICCDVCPNRANMRITEKVNGVPRHQVIHIDAMCNECGNCGNFCPHAGLPYRDKFTVFSAAGDFENSNNTGFLPLGDNRFRLRLEDKRVLETPAEEIPARLREIIDLIMTDYRYVVESSLEGLCS